MPECVLLSHFESSNSLLSWHVPEAIGLMNILHLCPTVQVKSSHTGSQMKYYPFVMTIGQLDEEYNFDGTTILALTIGLIDKESYLKRKTEPPQTSSSVSWFFQQPSQTI